MDACHPSTWEAESEHRSRLGYIVRPQKPKPRDSLQDAWVLKNDLRHKPRGRGTAAGGSSD